MRSYIEINGNESFIEHVEEDRKNYKLIEILMQISERKIISQKTHEIDVNKNITFYFQKPQNEFLKETFFSEFVFYLLNDVGRTKLIDL